MLPHVNQNKQRNTEKLYFFWQTSDVLNYVCFKCNWNFFGAYSASSFCWDIDLQLPMQRTVCVFEVTFFCSVFPVIRECIFKEHLDCWNCVSLWYIIPRHVILECFKCLKVRFLIFNTSFLQKSACESANFCLSLLKHYFIYQFYTLQSTIEIKCAAKFQVLESNVCHGGAWKG